MSDAVSVHVLGAVLATVDGAPVDVPGRRSRELLARLVLAKGHVVSTDRLIDDLWSGDPPPKALNSLQVHVSHLRRALDPTRERRAPHAVVVSSAPGYALRLDHDAVDVWRFEATLARATENPHDPAARRTLLADALAGWTGAPYAEFADTDWATPECVRLEDVRRFAVESLAATDLELGEANRAVTALEPLVAADRTRESTAHLLALAQYRCGRQADALATLRQLRRSLVDELGVDPSPALRALEADILAHAPTLSSPDPSPPPPPLAPDDTVRPAQLAGRTAEVADLRAAATAARAGRSAQVAWIAGEAGDGKSALAGAAAAALAADGWRTLWGRCPEVDGAPPGWAWREVADGLCIIPPGPDEAAFTVAHRLADALNSTQPVVVLLEDLHRADDLTVQVLRQLVDSSAATALLVVGTYRPSEETLPLTVARGAVAAATAVHLRLGGLDRTAVAHLVRDSGLNADDATLDLLLERTAGHPLFVRELARLLGSRGRQEAAAAVPDGVADVVRARAARLPADAQSALRQAAVLGRDVDLDVLAAYTGRDPDELLDALEAPVLARLLDDAGDGRLRFDHALVRDTCYADIPPLRRARWHAQVLAVLERRTPDAVDALAHHAMAALRPETAAAALRHTRAAADRALRLGAPSAAAALYRQALRAATLAAPTDAALQVGLRAAATRALAQAGDAIGGRALQREAVALADGDDELTRTAMTAWDAPLIWSLRPLNEADPVLLPAVRGLLAVEREAADRARLLCALVLEIENLDDEELLAATAEALALARTGDDDRLLCAALNLRAYAALGPDLADEREPLARELIEVATRAGYPDYRAAGHWLAFLAAAARGDLVAAQPEVDTAVELAGTGQLAGLLGVLAVWRATLHLLAGQTGAGLAHWAAISDQLAANGTPNAAVMALVGRIVAGFAAGDLADLADDLVAIPSVAAGPLTALALLDAGRVDEARRAYAATPPVQRSYYWLGLTTALAHAAARLDDVSAARELSAALSPWAGRVAGLDSGTMPLGPVDDALVACAELLGDHAAAEQHRRGAAEVRTALTDQLARLGFT